MLRSKLAAPAAILTLSILAQPLLLQPAFAHAGLVESTPAKGSTVAADQPVVAVVGYPNVGKSTLFRPCVTHLSSSVYITRIC